MDLERDLLVRCSSTILRTKRGKSQAAKPVIGEKLGDEEDKHIVGTAH